MAVKKKTTGVSGKGKVTGASKVSKSNGKKMAVSASTSGNRAGGKSANAHGFDKSKLPYPYVFRLIEGRGRPGVE